MWIIRIKLTHKKEQKINHLRIIIFIIDSLSCHSKFVCWYLFWKRKEKCKNRKKVYESSRLFPAVLKHCVRKQKFVVIYRNVPHVVGRMSGCSYVCCTYGAAVYILNQ